MTAGLQSHCVWAAFYMEWGMSALYGALSAPPTCDEQLTAQGSDLWCDDFADTLWARVQNETI